MYRNDSFKRRGARYPGSIDGKMSDFRVAFAELLFGKFVIRQYLPQDEKDEEMRAYAEENQVGPTVQLQLALTWLRRPISLNLTSLTEPELDAMRTIINLAFDLALPVVRDRDKVAKDAQKAGDDSFARVYRQIPVLVIREGKVITYGEGVHDGSADVPEGAELGPDGAGDPDGERPGGGVRGAGISVADEAPTHSGPEDDRPEAD
jgi:hypothetical protein